MVGFRVWGRIDGKQFDQVFKTVAEWRVERKMIENVCKLVVIGMASVELA